MPLPGIRERPEEEAGYGSGGSSGSTAHDLPATLVEGLESGPYGRDHLADIDRRLLALVGL
jgi:hypothetical protein